MADDSPIEKASNLISIFQRITMTRFLEFLSINNIGKLSCPLCKRGDELIIPTMRYPDSDDNTHYFLTPVRVKSMDYDYDTLIANYSYRVICQLCGHEMHFSCAPVAFWDQDEKKRGGMIPDNVDRRGLDYWQKIPKKDFSGSGGGEIWSRELQG